MVCAALSAPQCVAAGISCVSVRTAIPDCASGLLGRGRATHLVRPVRVHAHPDSRYDDRLVDRTEPVLFHGWLAVRQTFAVGVLGLGRRDWTECPYQKPDRRRISLRNYFLFLLIVGDLRHLLKMRLVSSMIVFLVVAAPWHILAALQNPPAGQARGFLWFFFVNEQFLRYLGKRYPADYGTVPFWLFLGLLLLWLLPWSAFLPQALAKIRLRLARVEGARRSPEAVLLLLLCWAVFIVLFFSFSTRQEYYVAPALPALALLLGHWLSLESQAQIGSPIARAGRISSVVLMVVGVLIAGITGALAIIFYTPAKGVELSDLLSKNPDAYVLSLGHFLDLTGNAMRMFHWPLIGTAVAFLFGTVMNWYFRRGGKAQAANWALVAMMVLFIECVHVALSVFYPLLGSQPPATAILREYQPGEVIVSDGEYSLTSSINF